MVKTCPPNIYTNIDDDASINKSILSLLGPSADVTELKTGPKKHC